MEVKAKVQTFIYVIHYMYVAIILINMDPTQFKVSTFNYVIYMALIHINMDRT